MKRILFFLIACFLTQITQAQSIQYFRDILMNHMTPRAELRGVHPISVVTADRVAHYKFAYDKEGKTIEIINSHPAARGKHPLTDIGAYRVQIDYQDNKETRTFYDKNGKRVRNMRQVAKEIFTYDAEGFRTGLTYYDEQDEAIASGWDVAKYVWIKHGDKVIEKRYNLEGNPQVLAPFFTLGTTMIEYGPTGLITAQYNVDDQYNIKPHSSGMASYHDFHDQFGCIIYITYRDENGELITAADGDFATILYIRNLDGNILENIGIDVKGKEIWHDIYKYDSFGNRIGKK